VGGTVTPVTFVLQKSSLAVTSQSIANKGHMTVSVPGGTHEVEVPRFLRLETCLATEQLIEVAHLALSLEAMMGYPVDIECAVARGDLYLLQCRPITTLK
jgi:pyruvate, water dikinase